MRVQERRLLDNIDFEIDYLSKEFASIKVAYRDRIFTPAMAKQQLISLYERVGVLLRICEGTQHYSRSITLREDVQQLVRSF